MKSPRIDPGDARPPYVQLADALRADFTPSTKLPHSEELADAWNVSTRVVRRAVAVLRDEGLITSSPGRGMFYVAERPSTADAMADDADTPDKLAAELRDLAQRVARLSRDK